VVNCCRAEFSRAGRQGEGGIAVPPGIGLDGGGRPL
jgi:hypothetical protein